MTSIFPGKRFGGIAVWVEPGQDQGPAATRWRYLPAAPSPQRNASGSPQVTVVEAGGMLLLSIGTVLSASEEDLGSARAAIAAETGAGAAAIDLRPADVTMTGATLSLVAEDAIPRELARAAPSPLPPHSAAFSAMLQGDAATAANSVIKAGTGRLVVAYDLELPFKRSATARIEGDWADATDVEAAIEAGRLVLTLDADEGASDALKTEVRSEAIRKANALLARLASDAERCPPPEPGAQSCEPPEPDAEGGEAPKSDEYGGEAPGPTAEVKIRTSQLTVNVTRTEPAPRAFRLEADVVGWL